MEGEKDSFANVESKILKNQEIFEPPKAEKYYGLARYLARKEYWKFHEKICTLELDDFFQEGVVGLLEAIKKYNPSKGPFPPFASIYIRGRIIDLIRRWYHISQKRWEKIKWLLKKEEELSQIKKGEPTLEELAKFLGITEKELEKILFYGVEEKSFDKTTETDEGELIVVESIPPESSPYSKVLDDEIEKIIKMLIKHIESCIDIVLNDEEKFIFRGIKMRGETLVAIGQVLKLSKDTVQRKGKKAEIKIKECLVQKGWTEEKIRELLS